MDNTMKRVYTNLLTKRYPYVISGVQGEPSIRERVKEVVKHFWPEYHGGWVSFIQEYKSRGNNE